MKTADDILNRGGIISIHSDRHILGAEIGRLRDENKRLRTELERERKRLDWALSREAFYDHTTQVFFCDRAFKIAKPQVRISTDNPRATIDELMGDTP